MQNPSIFTAWGWNPTGDFGPLTVYTAKNKKPVMFLKAPPKTPATYRQRFIRDRMTFIARYWSMISKEKKEDWERASKRAHLRMTGYNLFQWFWWHNNRTVLRTIERQSGVKLLD